MRPQSSLIPWHTLAILALALCFVLTGCSGGFNQADAQSAIPYAWPPAYGRLYPDLTLPDQSGKPVRLSSFKGKILLIEPIGMSCPACQAFNGANSPSPGPFAGCSPQSDLASIDQYLTRQGISISDPRLVFVELLLYSPSMQAPTLAEAQAWARHFHLDRAKNKVVLVGNSSLINQASYNMIPGFQLVDKNFVLLSDCTGHNPKHDLSSHLIPTLKSLLSR